MQKPVSGFRQHLFDGGCAPLDQPALGRIGQGRESVRHLIEHGGGNVGQAAESRWRGDGVEAAENFAERLKRGQVVHPGESVVGIESFEQHRAGAGVMSQQLHRPVASTA